MPTRGYEEKIRKWLADNEKDCPGSTRGFCIDPNEDDKALHSRCQSLQFAVHHGQTDAQISRRRASERTDYFRNLVNEAKSIEVDGSTAVIHLSGGGTEIVQTSDLSGLSIRAPVNVKKTKP